MHNFIFKIIMEIQKLRFFISGCNSLLGYCLVEELRNDYLTPSLEKQHIFCGTLDPQNIYNSPPALISKITSITEGRKFTKILDESDIIIYNLLSTPLSELRFITECIF